MVPAVGGIALATRQGGSYRHAMKRFVHAFGVAMALALSGCAEPRFFYFQYTGSRPPPEPPYDARGNPLSVAELLPDGRWVKKMDVRSEPWGARFIV